MEGEAIVVDVSLAAEPGTTVSGVHPLAGRFTRDFKQEGTEETEYDSCKKLCFLRSLLFRTRTSPKICKDLFSKTALHKRPIQRMPPRSLAHHHWPAHLLE